MKYLNNIYQYKINILDIQLINLRNDYRQIKNKIQILENDIDNLKQNINKLKIDFKETIKKNIVSYKLIKMNMRYIDSRNDYVDNLFTEMSELESNLSRIGSLIKDSAQNRKKYLIKIEKINYINNENSKQQS